MDNVNKQVVEFFKSIGFTLIEIKSSVFRIEESTWVFQTDHKDHSVDASTILYEDAEKIFTQARLALLTELRESIQTIDFYGWNEQTQSMIKGKVQAHLDELIKSTSI